MASYRRLLLCWLVGELTLGRFVAIFGASDIVVPLYQYDDYDRCRKESTSLSSRSDVYCLAKVILKEENRLNFTGIDTRFRRNLLERGICIAECQNELIDLSEEERLTLYQSKFEIDFVYTLSHFWKPDADPFIDRYDMLSNVCINQRLIRSHNVTGYTELEHCSSYNSPERQELDSYKITFVVVILAIFSTGFIANIIDCVKIVNNATKENLLVSAFSIRRNWARLIEEPKANLHEDFAYIDGVRVIICTWILLTHSWLPLAASPTLDQELIEWESSQPIVVSLQMLESGNVKIFLVITGLLLTTHFLEDTRKNPKSGGFEYCARKLIYRLFRLLPVYFVFLLHATVGDWIPGVDIGVSGYRTMTNERHICRKYGWANLLFVNNLPFVDVICMGHTWYLATDLQLFVVGLIVLETARKWPWILKPIIVIMIAFSACVVAGLVYFEGIEPLFVNKLSDTQLHYMIHRYIREIYFPSYTNLGCFASGMMVGYLYHQSKHHELKIQNYLLYKIIKWLTIPIMLAVILPIFVFLQYDIDYHRPWVILYSICFFYSPVLVCCVLFIQNFIQPSGPITKLLSSKLLAVLGKLTYSVYILHIPGLLMSACFQPLMMSVTLMTLPWIWARMTVISYLVAVIVYFCLEQPANLLLRGMFDNWCRGKRML